MTTTAKYDENVLCVRGEFCPQRQKYIGIVRRGKNGTIVHTTRGMGEDAAYAAAHRWAAKNFAKYAADAHVANRNVRGG